jgi:outer membrane protein OmpA-like peptidoglycan-associated protein
VVEPEPVVEPTPTPTPTPAPKPEPELQPQPQPAPVVEIRKFNDILYADNSVSPAEQSSSNLRDLAEYLKANPSLLVELNARGGAEGDAEVNLDLAKRRAVNLTDYLKRQGVTAGRVFINPIRLATSENQHSVGVECVRERTTTETASTTVAGVQKAAAGTSTSKRGLRFDNVIFDYNSIYPSEKSYANIGNLIVFMRNNSGYVLELSAYSDARGGANAAMKVSRQRANNLVDYLVKNGVARDRIEVNILGAAQPLNRCIVGVECSENEHAINRRVELVVRKK